jgi:hypothetical protein
MATQDFTTYSEVDPNGRFAVSEDEIVFTDLSKDEVAYIDDDKGPDYFEASFIHDFEIEITAHASASLHGIVWGIANLVGDWGDLISAESALFVELYGYAGGPRLQFTERWNSLTYRPSQQNISVGTTYYARVKRDESVGTYGRATLYLYSDSARTALVSSQYLDLHGKADFRYVLPITSYDSGNDALVMSGRIKDLDLDVAGNPTVTTQDPTNVTENTATGNGNITDVGQGSVLAHGVVWSLSNPFPTLTSCDGSTDEGAAAGTGAFTSNMTDLVRNRKYYYRAYASNTFGTGYGNVVQFYTDPGRTINLAFGQAITTALPDWEDVTADVIEYGSKRGRNHDLDKIEAGTATIVLKNLSGDYWRYKVDGPYYPDVKPLALVRVRHTWNGTAYGRFYGVVESWKHGWRQDQGARVPIVTLTCVDMFKSFARMKLYALPGTVGAYTNVVALKSDAASGQKVVAIKSLGDSATEGCDIKLLHVGQSVTIGDTSNSETNTIASIDEDAYELTMTNNLANTYATADDAYVKKFPQALSGVRVADVLYELGWPDSLADLDTGQLTVAELVPASDGENALDHIQAVAQSEGGIVFQAGDGKLTFQDRDARLSSPYNTAQATFSDDGNNQVYSMAEPEDDDTLIYNECLVDGDGITGQLYRDSDAQGDQGPRVLSRTGSLLVDDSAAFDQSYQIVKRNNDSVLRIPRLTIYPEADPSNLYPKVLGYEISTRINVEMNEDPNPAGIDKDYHIEGIEEYLGPDGQFEVTWQLWDVNLFRIMQAEHSGYLYAETVVDYDTVHDAANADDVYNDNDVIGVGQANEGGGYWKIWRGVLQFDTSAIGTATIASAEIIMLVSGLVNVDNAFDLTLVPATDVSFNLVAADYGDLLDDTTSYGTVTFAVGNHNRKVIIITLNSAGIAAINKTGTTIFGLRSSRDISDTEPVGDVEEYIVLEGTGSGSEFVPRLVVELNEAF